MVAGRLLVPMLLRGNAYDAAAGRKDSGATAATKTESLSTVIPRLMGFVGKLDSAEGLPCSLKDYLELVDWSGRAISPHKRGKIADHQPKILQRLQLEPAELLRYLGHKDDRFHHVIGRKSAIRDAAVCLGRKFMQGMAAADRLFPQRI